jgi:hypothetical protein
MDVEIQRYSIGTDTPGFWQHHKAAYRLTLKVFTIVMEIL